MNSNDIYTLTGIKKDSLDATGIRNLKKDLLYFISHKIFVKIVDKRTDYAKSFDVVKKIVSEEFKEDKGNREKIEYITYLTLKNTMIRFIEISRYKFDKNINLTGEKLVFKHNNKTYEISISRIFDLYFKFIENNILNDYLSNLDEEFIQDRIEDFIYIIYNSQKDEIKGFEISNVWKSLVYSLYDNVASSSDRDSMLILNEYEKTLIDLDNKKLQGNCFLFSIIEYVYFYEMIKNNNFKDLTYEVLKASKEDIQKSSKRNKVKEFKETQKSEDKKNISSYKDDGFKHFRRGSTEDLKFDLTKTEVGAFFKDMYDDLLKASPILRGIGWLTKLTTKVAQAVDVKYGSGRIASFLERIEDLREDWVINLGETEYSDLIRERQLRKKYAKRPTETEEEKTEKIENVKKGLFGSQVKGLFGESKRMTSKSDAEKASEYKPKSREKIFPFQIDNKEDDEDFKKEIKEFQDKSKAVQTGQSDNFKMINERLSAIENILAKLSQSEVNASINTNININTSAPKEEKDDKDKDEPKKQAADNDESKKRFAVNAIGNQKMSSSCPDPNKSKQELQQKFPEDNKGFPETDEVKLESKKEEIQKILQEHLNKNKNLYAETMKNFNSISKRLDDIKQNISNKFGSKDTISKSVFKNKKALGNVVDQKKDKKVQNFFKAIFGKLKSLEEKTSSVPVIMPKEQKMRPKDELKAKRMQERQQLRAERQAKKEAERMRRQEEEMERKRKEEEEKEKESEESGGGFSIMSILPILLGIGGILMAVLGGAFLFNFIKRLIFPEISFFNASSGEDIDSMIAEISGDEEKKKKIADALKKRLSNLADIRMNYQNRDKIAEYAALASGDLKEDNVYTQKQTQPTENQAQTQTQQAQAKQSSDNKQLEQRVKALETYAAATAQASKQEAEQVSQAVQRANENINVANQSVPNKPSEIS